MQAPARGNEEIISRGKEEGFCALYYNFDMPNIRCWSIFGNYVEIPLEKLSFRPSVYAVIVQQDRLLLMTNHSNGKLTFPGGGVELGETLEQALRREMREETGLEIEIGPMSHAREDFFYYDPGDKAFHSFLFYYRCQARTLEIPYGPEDDDESEAPRWLELAGLTRKQIQPGNEEVFDLVRKEVA